MTAQEMREVGTSLAQEHKYAEALPLLLSAASTFPDDEVLWQHLVLAASALGNHQEAVEFGKAGVRNHPRSSWLWRQLGSVLTDAGRLDESEKALNHATVLAPPDAWLWRYLAKLHRARQDYAREAEALGRLQDLGEASGTDLNQLGIARNYLGIACYNQGQYDKACRYYRQAAAVWPDATPLFNMGLVFNHPEVSQDADAADAYRRALAIDPGNKRAREQLEATKQKLFPLAAKARVPAGGLVQPHERFQFYLSPFQVLQLEEGQATDEVDVKAVQRSRKRLLQEIDLNDGKVSWLGNYALDKSRALALEDELHDEEKRYYHWAVFQNKRLLRFLSLGEIKQFLYSDEYFPQETLELLDEQPGFRSFLSKPFARQYNLVLTRALEHRLLPVVEALFDGRRWVLPEDEEVCFEGASRQANELVALMRSKARDGQERKVTIRELEDLLGTRCLPEVFNLLPMAFRTHQNDLVAEIRSLAITCYNEHGDADLSRSVLALCKRFRFKDAALNKRLDDDYSTIDKMIAEERKHEARLQFGADRPFEIKKEGIRDGDTFFPSSAVQCLRWGILATGYRGAMKCTYTFCARSDDGTAIVASWHSGQDAEERHTALFNSMVDAALSYLADAVLEKICTKICSGVPVRIGSCLLTEEGLHFTTTGVFWSKKRFLTWAEAAIDLRQGQVVISHPRDPRITIDMPIATIDNAVLLPFISTIMKGKGPHGS